MNTNQYEIIVCNECGSEFYRHSSRMSALCPECAHILYGCPACVHLFVNGRCRHCYWNGKRSEYISWLVEDR